MEHHFLDQYSDRDSLIHRLDPRVKAITFFSLVLFVILTPAASFSAFGFYGALLIILIAFSKVPPIFVVRRSLVIIPFVVIVGLFMPFIKGGRSLGNYSLGAVDFSVTYEGVMLFWNIFIKAMLSCISLTVLTSTTRFVDLLKGFETMHLPKLLIMILSFMYRYIYVFIGELMSMRIAKESRSAGGGKRFHLKAIANMVGVFFIRAYERGERVYLAMCSRGFDGTVRTLNRLKLNARDIYFSFSVIALLITIRCFAK
ncbi:MAG: cobalt ECF transporter T component CbiQ [Candidatus Omnitrophica bacterium]|nr:cobalt ECF transporter T component CbiQ [Candidatus Omnitrophota bacterium]